MYYKEAVSWILIYIFLTLAGYDYKINTSTLKFEPFDGITSQQCLEIEIINDSLPEDWEVFTLLFSTNNSTINLTTHRFDVSIKSNDGKYRNTNVMTQIIIRYLMYVCMLVVKFRVYLSQFQVILSSGVCIYAYSYVN